MKTLQLLLCAFLFNTYSVAFASQAYLDKFQTYLTWSNQLPDDPSSEFIDFINTNTPLAKKLRKKWLYYLAEQKNWAQYLKYYQDMEDIDLQCYAATALYHQGKETEALERAKPLWLSGSSQPSACDELFQLLLNHKPLNESLISQRIALALDKRNLSLTRYLLKQYPTPRLKDIQLLNQIYRNPSLISQLETEELHDDYYLYGLKRMVSLNMEQAIRYWRHIKTKNILSEKQQQAFLAHLSLYKAMRNHKDTSFWFSQVKPDYYTDVLLDWQIRFALKQHQWREVQRLISLTNEQDNPVWQYWLARAMEAQGQRTKALPIYDQLANTRNYYGFLASLRIQKPFNFEQEPISKNLNQLQPYQSVLDNIANLYHSQHVLEASRLLNDFVLELPKDERSALALWLKQSLKWYGKSLFLANSDDALNNQLSLRFPLAYQNTIQQYAKRYNIPSIFIFSIIRQESTFREDIISFAGAYGLMQVMPATATLMSKRHKITYTDKRQLFVPEKNIHLGVAYLHYLSKRFNHHPLLIAAAYNAGPSQVSYWLKHHPPKQIDIWIETLPWHETRNYLKNIVAFYAVYQYRLNKKPNLSEFFKPLNLNNS